MRSATSTRTTLAFALASCLFASTASAGPLDGHPNAFFDGSTTWSGTTSFFTPGSGPGDFLSGYIEWAVFGPGDFPYAGYVPTPGELTYAYQIFVDAGSHSVSQMSVSVFNPADNDGSFADIGTVPDTSSSIGPTEVTWNFAGIPQSSNSIGLAYSSPRLPTDLFGAVIDGGLQSFVIPLPSPGDVNIPEPATVTLLALGCIVGVPFARRALRRR